MNKKKIIIYISICIIILIITIFFVLYKYKNQKNTLTDITVVPSLMDKINKDSIWCGNFQLVWNDIKKEIVHGDILFNPQMDTVVNLNKESFKEEDIPKDYYFKIYGRKNLELKKEIEEEIWEKFKQKSKIISDFNWSEDALDNSNSEKYFFYTYLYRNFEFVNKFNILDQESFGEYDNINFFGVVYGENKAKEQIEVLFYNSKDNFAVKLNTKDSDEVIFYKNPEGKTFEEIYNNLLYNASIYKGSSKFNNEDIFKAPFIKFNTKREYTELENKAFYSYDGKETYIEKAIQSISFSLNDKGGTVLSESAIETNTRSISNRKDGRSFLVDDTFVLFLKNSTKSKPYLALKVDDITKYQ